MCASVILPNNLGKQAGCRLAVWFFECPCCCWGRQDEHMSWPCYRLLQMCERELKASLLEKSKRKVCSTSLTESGRFLLALERKSPIARQPIAITSQYPTARPAKKKNQFLCIINHLIVNQFANQASFGLDIADSKSFTVSPAVLTHYLKVKVGRTKLEVGQSASQGSRRTFFASYSPKMGWQHWGRWFFGDQNRPYSKML